MSIAPYAIGGSAIVVGLAVGYVKYMEHGTQAREAKADLRSAVAECSTATADDVTQAARDQIATLTRQANEWKDAAIAADRKSRERLAAFNALNRKIGNVQDNPPVPDAIELNLDAARMRGAVPRAPGEGGSNEAANGRSSDSDGHDLSPGTDPTPEAPGS